MSLVEFQTSGLTLPEGTTPLIDGFIFIKNGIVKLSCNETCLEVSFVLDGNNNMGFLHCLSLGDNDKQCIHILNKGNFCELSKLRLKK